MTGLPKGVTIGDFGDAAWRKEYGRRVGGVMDTVARAGGHVVWIGLPQHGDPGRRSASTCQRVVAAQARKRERHGDVHRHLHHASPPTTGGYAQYLPDAVG